MKKQNIHLVEDILPTHEDLLEQKKSLEEAYYQVKELSRIGQEITAQLSFHRILLVSTENLNRLMDATIFSVGIYEPKLNSISIYEFNLEKDDIFFASHRLEDDSKLSVKCFKEDKMLVLNDFQSSYKRYIPRPDYAISSKEMKSLIYLPVKSKFKSIGIISIQSKFKNAYTQHHLNLLENLSAYLGIAIENAIVNKQLKLQREELIDQKRQYQSLVEIMPQILFRKDLKGRFTYANRAFLNLVEMELDDLIGQNAYAVYPKKLADEYSKDDYWVIENNQVHESIKILKTLKNNKTYFVQIVKSPIRDAKNRVIGIQTLFWDITERQKAQDQLKLRKIEIESQADQLEQANYQIQQINTNLEDKVEQRTHQLKKMNEELDMFLYRASHDLRRPLTSLMGLSEIAEISIKDRDAIDLFKKVDNVAVQMDKMLQKLIMVSEIQHQNNSSDLVDFNLILEELQKQFENILHIYEVELHYENLLKEQFYSNPELIGFALSAMLENSIYFSKQQEDVQPFVRIVVDGDENLVNISVADNGTGIEKEYFSKIFDMYFKANEKSRGNGLGLYAAKKAIDKLFGIIKVESKVNEYTKFTISLPSNPPAL